MAEDKAKKEGSSNSSDVEKNKTIAVLSYLIFFLPLLTEAKDSKFAKFHANQSLIVVLMSVVAWTLNATFVGIILGAPIGIASFVFWVMGIMNALNGEMKRLPIVGGVDIIK